MLKIYSLARFMIDHYLNEIVAVGKLNPKSAIYKTAVVEEEMVVFLIHDQLKMLLEEQLKSRKPKFAKCYFLKNDRRHWLVTIEAGGAESFFFARQLQRILHKTDCQKEKKRYIKANLDFLGMVIAGAVKKAKKNPDDFIPLMEFEKKVYSASLQINGTLIQLSDASVDLLARAISNQIPGFLKIITEAK